MITQIQSDSLNTWLDVKIAKVNREIEDAEAVHAEAPNRTEYFDMKHDDAISELVWQLWHWEQVKRDAEDIDIEDVPAVLPKGATVRLSGMALSTLAVLGLFMVGAMVGVAVLFNDGEIGWR